MVLIQLLLEPRILDPFPASLTRCFLCSFFQPAGCVGGYLNGLFGCARTIKSSQLFTIELEELEIFLLLSKKTQNIWKILQFTLIRHVYRGTAHLRLYLKVQAIHFPSFSGIILERNTYLTFGEGNMHFFLCTDELWSQWFLKEGKQ